ncbi:DNA-binding protein [Rhodovulum strictum]|uniref:HTH Mu-type domain-containing protein n=1 Tax=Rhodovulum strictum TaxID=58314 RepID=A0A844BNF7_9RHOB|nr:DNA-binding protein [Rhodovulum strictum]MRH21497.1 hypothetical protein [Rhodovulum strictum]
MTGELPLTVQVPAEDWAYAQRRIAFMEALLLRVVRERRQLQEWFTAAELAEQRLPGLPGTRAAITRKARRENWLCLPVKRQDRRSVAYHVSALPPRAFDALIARILDLPALDAGSFAIADLPKPQGVAEPVPDNTAPPWVLPLMRILRNEAHGDLSLAWRTLPDHLAPGTVLPDVHEAARILLRLGLA